jgi:hypothetical protein
MLNKSERVLSSVTLLMLILLGSTGTILPVVGQAISPLQPCIWKLSVSPQEVHIQAPQCWTAIDVDVIGDSCGRNISIFCQYRVTPTRFSLGNIYLDKVMEKGGLPASYRTTVFLEAPWTMGGEERELEVWAFEKGDWSFAYPNPDEHHQLVVIRVVVDKTGVQQCIEGTPTPTTWPTPTPTTTTPPPTYTPPPYNWWHWWRWPWEGWGWRWFWVVQQPFDFTIEVAPNTQSIKAGQSATYTVTVKLITGSSQPVALSMTGLPGGSTQTFTTQSGNPTFTSSLTVSTETSASVGTYPLTITGAGGGKLHSATVILAIGVAKTASSLTVTANPSTLNSEEPVLVSGTLAPAQATTVELIYQRPDGFEMTKHLTTTSTGTYTDTVKLEMPGMWSVKSRWQGDEKYFPTESSSANFLVQAPQESPWFLLAAVIIIALVIVIAALLIRRRGRPAVRKTSITQISKRYCAKCGSEIPEGSAYCMKCGEKV